MFRAWAGAARSAKFTTQGSAWEEVMRKLFTAQTRNFSRNTLRQVQSSSRAMASASSRYGATRPSFAIRQNIVQRPTRRGFRFSSWRWGQGSGEVKESLSLTQRFKKLSKEYGKAAVFVYFALSILDYPFFFLLVRTVGTERVAVVEHFIVGIITSVIPESVRTQIKGYWNALKSKFTNELGEEAGETVEMAGWGVEKAQERHEEEASLATQLALAYAIHKSFFFIRIPLTAAVTPKVVKKLRSWGWNIGKPIRKSN